MSSGSILALEKRGWARGPVEGGGCYWTTTRKTGGVEVVLEFEPGVFVGDPMVNPEQLISGVSCSGPASTVVMSELVGDLQIALQLTPGEITRR